MSGYNLQRLNVLVIEGHQMMRRLMHDVLSTLGVKNVEVFTAGQLGTLEKEGFDPDLIFADWSPHCDGISLIQDIRSHKRAFDRYLPIVMVTAYTELRQVCAARDAGTTEFLAKPFTANLIYRRICSMVENPRDFVQTATFFGPDRRRRALGPNGIERRMRALSPILGAGRSHRPALADLVR